MEIQPELGGKDWLTAGMRYILLALIVRISKYMWIIFYLFFKVFILLTFRICFEAACQ
jgi:hypothetical protein